MPINAPSLANCNYFELCDQVRELADAGISMFHVDIMDGHYVPNLCFPIQFVSDLSMEHPSVEVDVHLMVQDPSSYVQRLADAGANLVSFPADSTSFVRRTVSQIQESGMKAGVAINPSDRIDSVEPYLHLLDYVVLMTVEPGYAGQKFLGGSLERLEELSRLRSATGSKALIQIDGGVDPEIGRECVRRGADILVTGNYAVFRQPDGITAAVERFNKAVAEVAA